MDLSKLQAELRHFAAERDWQPCHTPKNLSTAMMVEAAELAKIFQWMTSEESQIAHQHPASKQQIAENVADVLLCLLQVADHCEIDVAQAVKDRLEINALKYPPKHTIARSLPVRGAAAGTHVLLDYENVQPTEHELRTLVPDVSQVWVFHGLHQRQVEQRFASFGSNATAVPISKTGKNALDFHLSFYMGYIASRNPATAMVVASNDKGYEPMLEHARSMGFAVRQVGHVRANPSAVMKAPSVKKANEAPKPAAKKAAAKKAPVKKAPPKKVVVKQLAIKQVPTKKVATKKAAASVPAATKAPTKKAASLKKTAVKLVTPSAAVKRAIAAPSAAINVPVSVGAGANTAGLSSDSAATIKKLSESLRKMGDKRPTKPASLRRSLKSFLSAGATEEMIEVALARLIADGVVKLEATKGASYPLFGVENGV